jgi:hypothetical protein
MPELLGVDIAGVQAMAARGGASVGELNTAAPSGLGLSYQASAAAVDAARADIAAFAAALATRVGNPRNRRHRSRLPLCRQ